MHDNNLYNDLKSGQAANNYSYNAIGNLVSDKQEGISAIKWNVYGKISAIQKNSTTINYLYDASGNRVMKQIPADTVAYVRDASGNVLSVYTKNKNGLVQQSETYLYGSSRLGVVRAQSIAPKTMKLNASFNDAKLGVFTRGEKMYELSNHLQNVLVTVSDKRLPVAKSNDTVVSGYNAVVMSASDYYPFGMEMVGRNVNTNTYRYGASSGQEKSTEINANSYTAEYWQYDSRIGRRWNVDPLADQRVEWTPYNAMSNDPINRIDPDGALDDWYKDAKGNLEYATDVKSQVDLNKKGISGTYVGETYTKNSKSGTEKYRSDGSIFFANQNDAYKRIWNNSIVRMKEQLGLILKEGVIVLPDYKNEPTESKFVEYGYDITDSKFKDPVDKSSKSILATIHSHPDKGGEPTPSFDDQKTFPSHTPNKPYLTMGYDGDLYGMYGSWNKHQDGKYYISDIKNNNIDFKHYGISNKSIQSGFMLREFLQEYIKLVLKK